MKTGWLRGLDFSGISHSPPDPVAIDMPEHAVGQAILDINRFILTGPPVGVPAAM